MYNEGTGDAAPCHFAGGNGIVTMRCIRSSTFSARSASRRPLRTAKPDRLHRQRGIRRNEMRQVLAQRQPVLAKGREITTDDGAGDGFLR